MIIQRPPAKKNLSIRREGGFGDEDSGNASCNIGTNTIEELIVMVNGKLRRHAKQHVAANHCGLELAEVGILSQLLFLKDLAAPGFMDNA